MKNTFAKLLIVVPMKDPSQSKTRLKFDMSEHDRRHLAQKLFCRTMDVICDVRQQLPNREIDLVVVTASSKIKRTAKNYGVNVINETSTGSLRDALGQAIVWAEARKYGSILILPADLADPSSDEISELISLAKPSETEVIISPSSDYGTNALLISPPSAIPLLYGDRSFFKHYRKAVRAGFKVIVAPLPSLKHDIDRAEDLKVLKQKKPHIWKVLTHHG
ncbi:MAG: 2-phospho-L-lactate guanylyltransferase [Marinovum sp.]|jgi:2-phospho-L-lactate/phosphoenolpyruvate guanylyltransferase|nr:2-phospho-L-lactate guanylyltransferase [Marinovum sp.]MBT6543804.1 2-phospho-L-lactate guanylyltransferase [Paracoccaceae bacterium]